MTLSKRTLILLPIMVAVACFCITAVVAAAAHVDAAPAQGSTPDRPRRFVPFGGGDGSGPSPPSGGFGSSNDFPNVFGNADVFATAVRDRTVHGLLASLAMVVLFPVGAILLRVLPAGRWTVWLHAAVQMLALSVYVAGAGLGLYLVQLVSFPWGNLITNPKTNAHPVLGIVVLALLLLQPILGLVHHARFKQLGRRTVWSHLHLWNGRLGVTLGIINGGLGLRLAHAARPVKIAYIVIAVVMWVIWAVTAVTSEGHHRVRQQKGVSKDRVRARPHAVRSSQGHSQPQNRRIPA